MPLSKKSCISNGGASCRHILDSCGIIKWEWQNVQRIAILTIKTNINILVIDMTYMYKLICDSGMVVDGIPLGVLLLFWILLERNGLRIQFKPSE